MQRAPNRKARDDTAYEHAREVVRARLHCAAPQGEECTELGQSEVAFD